VDNALAEIGNATEAEFNADLRHRMVGTVRERGGCTSWYLDNERPKFRIVAKLQLHVHASARPR
jgi:hypothetical protein